MDNQVNIMSREDFDNVCADYERVLALAKKARAPVWTLYRAYESYSPKTRWHYVGSYPTVAAAKLHCPIHSSYDHAVVQEQISAIQTRYDTDGFPAQDSTERLHRCEVYPAQEHINNGGHPLPGRATWVPCRSATAGGKVRAICVRPAEWAAAEADGLGKYGRFMWKD